MSVRRFTDEQEAEIAAQYPEKSTTQLAKLYDTSRRTIRRLIVRQGGKTESRLKGGRRFTDEQEAEIAAQYPEKTIDEIAKINNANPQTIRALLKRQGIKIRSNGEAKRRFTDEQERAIAAQYPEKSVDELAKIHSAGANTIRRLIVRQGRKLRSISEAHEALRRFTDEQEAEIAAQYPAKSTVQLAKIHKASIKSIRGLMNRQGVEIRSLSESKRKFTDEQEQEICQRYLLGEDSPAIGDSLDVSSTCICYILDHNGIERRASGTEFGDSVQHALESAGRHTHARECELYLFELARYSDTHCKLGIAFDTDHRARHSQGEYGEEVLRLFFATRAEAFFLEQAVLDATRGSAGYPDGLIDWAGYSEVRMMPAEDMVPTVLRLAEELEELGQWEFAARYVPMTTAQRAICQQRAQTPEVAK